MRDPRRHRLTLNVSFGSPVPSPLTCTVAVLAVAPGSKVTVPVVASSSLQRGRGAVGGFEADRHRGRLRAFERDGELERALSCVALGHPDVVAP
jgi:hypothetical protein